MQPNTGPGPVEVANAFVCSPGVAHAWGYQGGPSERYLCTKCGGFILKARLKAETDA